MESRLEALVSRRRNDYGFSVAHCTHKSYHGRSCVKSRLQELSSELRKSAQAERLTRLSKSRAWELNYELRSVAMIIYILTNFFYRPVIAYLQRAARVRRWPQRGERELEILVDKHFLECDMTHMMKLAVCCIPFFLRGLLSRRLANVEEPLEPQFLKTASRYIEEWSLVLECEMLNKSRGVAVTTRMLIDRARSSGTTLPHWVQNCAASAFGQPKAAERKWASSFRKRWNARLGKIKATEPQTIEEMQLKVRA